MTEQSGDVRCEQTAWTHNRLAYAVMHIARVYLAIMALHHTNDTGAVDEGKIALERIDAYERRYEPLRTRPKKSKRQTPTAVRDALGVVTTLSPKTAQVEQEEEDAGEKARGQTIAQLRRAACEEAQFLQYSGIRRPRQDNAKTTLFPRPRKRPPQGSSPEEGNIGRVRFVRVQPELRTSELHPLRRARQEEYTRVRRRVLEIGSKATGNEMNTRAKMTN